MEQQCSDPQSIDSHPLNPSVKENRNDVVPNQNLVPHPAELMWIEANAKVGFAICGINSRGILVDRRSKRKIWVLFSAN